MAGFVDLNFMKKTKASEFERFDNAMKKVLSVSRDELKRREKTWKHRKKRAKTSHASRAANDRA
jgi:hypothetical protein